MGLRSKLNLLKSVIPEVGSADKVHELLPMYTSDNPEAKVQYPIPATRSIDEYLTQPFNDYLQSSENTQQREPSSTLESSPINKSPLSSIKNIVKQPINLPPYTKSPFSNQDLEMQQAQQAAQSNLQNAMLGESFGKLAQTIANAGRLREDRTDFDDSMWKLRQATANQPVEQLLVGRKAQEQKNELDIQAQKMDPNSPISKTFQQALKSLDPSIQTQGLSLAEGEKVFPSLASAINIKESRDQRAMERQLLSQSKLDKEKLKEDEKIQDFAKDLRKEMYSGKVGELYTKALKANKNLTAMEEAIKSPTGYKDLGTIYGYLKSLDEDSAVREGELALGLKQGSIPVKLKARFKQFLTGQMLDPSQRKQMLDVISAQAKASINDYNMTVEPIRKQAKALNVPEEYLPKELKSNSIKKVTFKDGDSYFINESDLSKIPKEDILKVE